MTRRFTLIVLLVALTFVPTSSQAQNSGLTPEVLKKLERAATEGGVDHVIVAVFATSLGLTENLDWPDRQLLTRGTDDRVHAFILSRGDDRNNFVLYVHLPDGSVNVFHTRRDGRLVKAINVSATKKITPLLDVGDAQKELDAEIDYWARSGLSFLNK